MAVQAGASETPAAKAAAAADRWESAIQAFEAQDRKSAPAKGGIVFVGSSSIRLWSVERSFPGMGVLNRGFGGSHLADSVRYVERIVTPYQPRVVVLYAGDNDLAAGKSPEQVAADYRKFVAKVHAALPKARIVYIAVKPSLARWKLIEKVRETNRLIRDSAGQDSRLVFVDVERPMLGPDGKPRPGLFLRDGLHLNAEGYRIWTDLVRPHL
jgi:lysophospholipase L1-like esterase